jgi:hypothetical protein
MAPSNNGMDIHEIRLANLRMLAADLGSDAALARKLDMAYPLLHNYIGKNPTKRIGDKTARRAEAACGKEHGWMDQLRLDLRKVGDPPPAWPFPVERERFDALPAVEKRRIYRFMQDTVETWEDSQVEASGKPE